MVDEPLFPHLQTAPQGASDLSQNSTIPPMAEAPAPPPPTATLLIPDPPPAEISIPDLFEDAPVNASPTDGNSGMMDSVVSTEEAKGQKILGPKPKMSAAFNSGAHEFNLGGFLFKLSFLLALLVYGFFYTQFNDSFSLFSKNPTQTLASFESSFQTEQTETNLYNMLIAKFALDDFMSSADAFSLKWAEYQSAYTAGNTQETLMNDMGKLQDEMKLSLTEAQKRVSTPLYPKFLATSRGYTIPDLERKYQLLLKEKVMAEKQKIDLTPNEQSFVEKANLSSAEALASDSEFRHELASLDLTAQLNPDKVESLFNQITGINKNLYATILNIKESRVNWPEVINELERVTKKVDPLYGTSIKSNIDYSNLSVNASDRTISIRGETHTDDTRNFSLLSNLIDELEKSPRFADVSNRTFSKSGQEDENFTSSFNLTFALQEGEDPRDSLSDAATVSAVPFPSFSDLYTAPPVDEAGLPSLEDAFASLKEESTEQHVELPSGDAPVFPQFVAEGAEGTTNADVVVQTVELTPEQNAEMEAAFNAMTPEELDAAFNGFAETVADGLGATIETPAADSGPASMMSLDLLEVLTPMTDFLNGLFDVTPYFEASIMNTHPRVPRNPRNH